jgi:beta-aspartyl-peptidase (threonine type)
MEKLPHVLLAGEGADRFVHEMGFEPAAEMLTDDIREVWASRLKPDMTAEQFENIATRTDLWHLVKIATDPQRVLSTVNFIAQDSHGDICSGVSTSGWSWKYPGRVGDSPIIGAGNYADNRYGACACTGMGEMAIRASTAHSVVFYMKMGLSLDDACTRAMTDLNDLGGRYISVMNLVALDKDGAPAGYTSMDGRTFIYQTAAMAEYAEQPRTYVEIESRWES